jgi:ATP-binding protein involved in chromosome partitioning
MAEKGGIPFLGEIPLVRALREAGDSGEPIVVADPESPQSASFRTIAERVLEELGKQTTELPTIH